MPAADHKTHEFFIVWRARIANNWWLEPRGKSHCNAFRPQNAILKGFDVCRVKGLDQTLESEMLVITRNPPSIAIPIASTYTENLMNEKTAFGNENDLKFPRSLNNVAYKAPDLNTLLCYD